MFDIFLLPGDARIEHGHPKYKSALLPWSKSSLWLSTQEAQSEPKVSQRRNRVTQSFWLKFQTCPNCWQEATCRRIQDVYIWGCLPTRNPARCQKWKKHEAPNPCFLGTLCGILSLLVPKQTSWWPFLHLPTCTTQCSRINFRIVFCVGARKNWPFLSHSRDFCLKQMLLLIYSLKPNFYGCWWRLNKDKESPGAQKPKCPFPPKQDIRSGNGIVFAKFNICRSGWKETIHLIQTYHEQGII